MMRCTWVLVLGLAGCPSDPAPQVWTFDRGGNDATIDMQLDQGQLDQGRADATPDMAIVLPMPDQRVPDQGGADAQNDMRIMLDSGMPDAAPLTDMEGRDAGPDAARDAVVRDASPPDMVGADVGPVVDAGPVADAAPIVDAAPDVMVDMAAPDAAPDMAPDPMARPPVGFCAPVRPEGWGCFNDDRACADGLTCINGTCSERSPFEGPCDGNSDCRAGQQLYCARYSDQGAVLQQPFCRQRGVAGAVCHRRNFGCNFGLVCVLDECRERSEIGGPCQTSGDCVLEAWCEINGLCAAYIPLGEPCNPQAPGCEPGFVCTDEVCSERAPPGDGCQHAGQCAIGQYCDRFDDAGNRREDGVCTPRQREGDPCDGRETSVCNASVCLEGMCVADQPEEGACQSSFDCESGFWCPRAF